MTNTIRTRSPASGQFVTQMNNVIRQICLATLLVLIGFASAAQATTVSLSAPSSGATYAAGSNITVSASASPSTGQTITKVDFYRGATLIATDTSKPYSIIWPAVPAGSYSLTAKATTNTGAVTTSGARTITVAAAPSVSLAAPANNAAFAAGSTIALSATATATGQTITKVDFYRGTTLIRSDTTAPYTATWSNAAAGNYSLTTRVTTSLGLTATSALVAVTVAAAPTISLTAPANNAVFGVGSNITIAATAAATGQTITQVDFYSGAALLGTATAAPYSFNWSNLPAGSYSLTARVTTSIGLTATSTATAISVAAAPSVSLTAPANNTAATAPASFTLSATASAASGQTISKVDFYSGATLLGTATAAPYSYIWGNVPAGSYSLTARATDSLGSVTTSTAATVAVNAPPTIALTAPANNSAATAPANLIVSADAADSDGSIAYVVFYASTGQAQATQIGILNTAPYSLNWSNVAAGNYQIIATATDNLGAVTLSSPISVTVNAPAQAGQALYFIETDHLDTPRQMSDAAGNVVWRWENLDAFGNNPPNDDPNGTGQHHSKASTLRRSDQLSSLTTCCCRRLIASSSTSPFSFTIHPLSPSSPPRSKHSTASFAIRQLRWMRTKRAANSFSNAVRDSSIRYSRSAVRTVMYFSSARR